MSGLVDRKRIDLVIFRVGSEKLDEDHALASGRFPAYRDDQPERTTADVEDDPIL